MNHEHNHQHSTNEYNNHSSHSHDSHHEHMIADFKRRFFISLILAIPVIILSDMIQIFFGYTLSFNGDHWVEFILATVIFFYGGWPFLIGLFNELKQKSPGMMTLIGFAISVAYIYSVATVFGVEGNDLFWELATLIVIMLLGHWIEMKSINKASESLEALADLMPQEANKIDAEGNTKVISVSQLQTGDHLLIKPGEKVPADAVIIKGKSSIDESMLTGESIPVEKSVKDEVIGGSINTSGSLTVEVSKTNEEGYLSQVIQLVKEAQESKSKTQMLSDRAAKLLFYVAVIAGILTFIIWLALGYGLAEATTRMVTVLVISCPHALGLAIPLVVARSTVLSANKGLFIRNRIGFEDARNIDTVVFDKTGTLTKGEFGVTDIITEGKQSEEDLLRIAASVESQSEHPIATGILNEAKNRNIDFQSPDEFDSITGTGIKAVLNNESILAVSPGYMEKENIPFDNQKFQELSEAGKTVIFIVENDSLIGMLALADQVKDSSKEAVARLHELGIHVQMLTGDNQKVAHSVAEEIGIDEVIAQVLPDEKADKIKQLKNENKRIAMTGDGINDAPALANADLGVAVGAGTDVAMESADVVLVNSHPDDVVSIIELSRLTYRKMIQNLWWAAGYNIIAIPLAAGILAPWGVVLDPAIGAVLMSLSTIIVAINARTLNMK
ncbi:MULTISPECIES: copper-translocating P-type ATPase [Oceanobacillus]|uniref:P-type Cu(+) transporter n=1 Tax=Oceanobacillus kimchii TaxID=746691 RepID=A0ABQ5TML9_9BACI|nr:MULTISPECIES: copper-translocating P-type ATPase [Oceanobacillus]MBT2598532.1 copper-translocating P-type ATPase [Oceanobacillus sp. ISL-74]MBT2651450.1 copper-translocating P-type ATPase [Oceanobacillus sp. ISL-73]OEH55838.1 ATPase [Oceanobacillus sp. E9]GLO66370.1 copper-translocating P-type ATPase [Oceanobacillus kimchii]